MKVDISRSEELVFKPVLKNAIIGYTDMEAHTLLCYPLEEVLVEKMRSVMQRMQARDYYDIWYLLEQHGMDMAFYVAEFRKKCERKKINPADFHQKLTERTAQYKARWKNSLLDQINNLPDFEKVEREIQRHVKKLKL